uniref:6-cysteine protein n=1 Tax=Strongyloides venezuelensis TaxID=75913 RepID=A0A0K0G2G1_STRVS
MIFIIHTCILFGSTISKDFLDTPKYSLEYYRCLGENNDYKYKNVFGGERYDSESFKIYGSDVKRRSIVFKIYMTKQFLTSLMYNGEMRIILRYLYSNNRQTSSLLPREPIMKNGAPTKQKDYLACNLYKCQIGFLYFCTVNKPHFTDHTKGEDYIYIGFTNRSSDNKNILNIIVCPSPTWLTEFSNSQYIETADNFLMKSTFGTNSNNYTFKYMYYHDIGVKTFVKCGHLKQMFRPSIDIGYECEKYNEEEDNRIYNKDGKPNEISFSNNDIMCRSVDMNKSLHLVNYKDFSNKTWDIERSIGYAINYESRCKVPKLNATLSLRINDVVQEFKNKAGTNSGGMDTYTFLSREIKNTSIGCHRVLDKINHSTFNNFYELLYSTSLSMLDEATQQYRKIEKPHFIKETEFIINLIYENSNNSSKSNKLDDSDSSKIWKQKMK